LLKFPSRPWRGVSFSKMSFMRLHSYWHLGIYWGTKRLVRWTLKYQAPGSSSNKIISDQRFHGISKPRAIKGKRRSIDLSGFLPQAVW
jgi:hypothetical protein